jgi:hypothetical protein
VLVDISGIAGLDLVDVAGGVAHLGPLVTHNLVVAHADLVKEGSLYSEPPHTTPTITNPSRLITVGEGHLTQQQPYHVLEIEPLPLQTPK